MSLKHVVLHYIWSATAILRQFHRFPTVATIADAQ
jgi:hypothetical protein